MSRAACLPALALPMTPSAAGGWRSVVPRGVLLVLPGRAWPASTWSDGAIQVHSTVVNRTGIDSVQCSWHSPHLQHHKHSLRP